MDHAELMHNNLGGVAKWSVAMLSLVDIASACPKLGPRFDYAGTLCETKRIRKRPSIN